MGLALALAFSAVASAAVCDKKIRLSITPAGRQIEAEANARVRSDGVRQSFRVELRALVPNGTTFAVFANGQLAGTITINFGVGALDLNNQRRLLPAGVNPVCSISTVVITDGDGNTIASGTF